MLSEDTIATQGRGSSHFHSYATESISCSFSSSDYLFDLNLIQPIRLAHMIREMQTLPEFMLRQPALGRVSSWYLDSFRELFELPHIDTTSVRACDVQHIMRAHAKMDREWYTEEMARRSKRFFKVTLPSL